MSIFVQNELAAQWTLVVLALIFSFTSMFWAPEQQAIIWLAIIVIAKISLLEICRKFASTPQKKVNVKVWYRRLFIAEACCGLAWASFALIGIEESNYNNEGYVHSSHVFLFASLIVVLAIRMTFASTLLPVLYVGTIPMTAAVVSRLLLQQDIFYLALATMIIAVHVYFIFLAKGLQKTAVSILEYRLQKDILIAELAEANSISDDARQRAEDANLAKSRFLATMSHELRTPLNAVLGFSEIMKNEILGPIENKNYREYAHNIHISGSHLLNLINEILDLSRIEAGKFDLNEQPVQICDVLNDSVSLLKLRANNKSIQIIENYDTTISPLWADKRSIKQICLNLLSNAIKFTPCGGRITLIARITEDGGQMLSIHDTGPGIPEHEIPKVLEAFGQGTLAQKIAEGGTGLGLPIVRKLVDLHGGHFELKSQLCKGTKVSALFPQSRVMRRKIHSLPDNTKQKDQIYLS
ncbi:MAG: Sensor histidine kinase RcsC [Hyphomicrobiaceae bacterium hypho_1]